MGEINNPRKLGFSVPGFVWNSRMVESGPIIPSPSSAGFIVGPGYAQVTLQGSLGDYIELAHSEDLGQCLESTKGWCR